MTVLGVDAYRKGWVAIALDDAGVFETAFVAQTMRDVLLRAPNATVIAVDIPLGYPDGARRRADGVARKFVGPRRSSVFETPPHAVWAAADYAGAATMSAELVGRGLSQQAWALRTKVRDADEAGGVRSIVSLRCIPRCRSALSLAVTLQLRRRPGRA